MSGQSRQSDEGGGGAGSGAGCDTGGRAGGGAAAYVAATLAANDPLLDAIGFSRGRFIVEQTGASTLVVPAWAEIERVTEDCRG